MTDTQSAVAQAARMSQGERLVGIFTAPSRTFTDIRNGNRSWWLPFVIMALTAYLFFGVVVQRIGVEQTVQNQIQMSPRAQEQMAQASPEQIQKSMSFSIAITRIAFLASPLLGLVYALVISAVFLGTINFAFGGRARFPDVFAAVYYAWLPGVVQMLMGIAVVWFQAPESFNIKNFAPTNPAALFLDPASSRVLYTFASQMDVITIWTLVLLGIGVSTVAGVKRSHGYITVFGWWAIVVLFKVGAAAAFGG